MCAAKEETTFQQFFANLAVFRHYEIENPKLLQELSYEYSTTPEPDDIFRKRHKDYPDLVEAIIQMRGE